MHSLNCKALRSEELRNVLEGHTGNLGLLDLCRHISRAGRRVLRRVWLDTIVEFTLGTGPIRLWPYYLKGYSGGSKQPKVTIVLVDPQQTQKRLTVERSGNYCFRRSAGSSGTLIVDVDGVEVSRRSISSFGAAQQREDFEIQGTDVDRPAPPGSISAKYTHPPNERTADLYRQAVEAEKAKDSKQVLELLKKIVAADTQDFIAWAKLGTLYLERNSLAEAEAALRKSIELKIDYVPAWIIVGQLRVGQKQFEAAAEVLKHAVSLDPGSARAYQLLGEAYLQSRQGTLGVEALNQAIKLEPIAMAECHLSTLR